MEVLAWVGGFMLAICAFPQAVECYKQKHARGVSTGMLLLWFFGEVFLAIYSWSRIDNIALFLNYFTNVVLLLIVLKYKFWPNNDLVLGARKWYTRKKV